MESKSLIDLIAEYFHLKYEMRRVEQNMDKMAVEIMKRMQLPIKENE